MSKPTSESKRTETATSPLDQDRIREILLQSEILSGLPETVEKFLDAAGESIEFSKGDMLIREGADDRDVYFVLTGNIAILKNNQDGTTHERHSYDAPQSVGEIAAQKADQFRTASVMANSERVVALKVPAQVYCDAIAENSEFDRRAHQRNLQMTVRNIGARRAEVEEIPNERPNLIMIGIVASTTGGILAFASFLIGLSPMWILFNCITTAALMAGAMFVWTVQFACSLGMSKVILIAVADRILLSGKGGMSVLGSEVASFEIERVAPREAIIDGTDILLFTAFCVYAYFFGSERSKAKHNLKSRHPN
ncbi:cyclic nucleotide-binding domain-containing protein [Sulfitobacter sp. AS59]|uniref:cyclic nucleotide-binding domain-containing protein n=1 Tax=Sulfitobacter sp. AS59 TaxID=3135784 RepID=UPI003171E53A